MEDLYEAPGKFLLAHVVWMLYGASSDDVGDCQMVGIRIGTTCLPGD